MEKFETKDGKIITYENGVVTLIDPVELELQKADIEARLVGVKEITDKELLTWAKINYSQVDHSQEVIKLAEITSTLESIK
jgi:hypothetical protein